MIKNEKQYKITRKALQGWQSTHEQLLHYRKPGTAKWVHDAQIESAKIQIRQLQAQMKEQQIQRYEETNYQSASLSTITRVAHALQFYKHQGHRVAAPR